ISRISQYINGVIRDKIGSIVDFESIQKTLSDWISEFVASVYQPSPLERARYPFRNVSIEVKTIPGKPCWYSCKINVIPHIQFEGMNTTITIATRLEQELFGTNIIKKKENDYEWYDNKTTGNKRKALSCE
ncbi:type VI secretion system contractile sheath large subunit, partial [Francisella tularensis subsp. holarctica]|nr:type VI secretion system contractile sheath large subunit [Francisella tularensis subsp. holarctica]